MKRNVGYLVIFPIFDFFYNKQRVFFTQDVWRGNPCCTFGLTIEDESEDAIFTMDPLTVIKNGLLRDIPFIMGVVENEGLISTGGNVYVAKSTF